MASAPPPRSFPPIAPPAPMLPPSLIEFTSNMGQTRPPQSSAPSMSRRVPPKRPKQTKAASQQGLDAISPAPAADPVVLRDISSYFRVLHQVICQSSFHSGHTKVFASASGWKLDKPNGTSDKKAHLDSDQRASSMTVTQIPFWLIISFLSNGIRMLSNAWFYRPRPRIWSSLW